MWIRGDRQVIDTMGKNSCLVTVITLLNLFLAIYFVPDPGPWDTWRGHEKFTRLVLWHLRWTIYPINRGWKWTSNTRLAIGAGTFALQDCNPDLEDTHHLLFAYNCHQIPGNGPWFGTSDIARTPAPLLANNIANYAINSSWLSALFGLCYAWDCSNVDH